jgi:hypothetical protein
MSKSTGPLQFDTERAAFPADYGDVGKSIHNGAQFEPNGDRPSSMIRPGEKAPLEEVLRWLARSFAILAILSSFALLCVGATPLLTALPAQISKTAIRVSALLKNIPLSAVPLLFAGASYIVLQAILRPGPFELLKRLMLGTAFLLWGAVLLMPASDLASELGNLVIALYVLDLGLIIWSELEKNEPSFVS